MNAPPPAVPVVSAQPQDVKWAFEQKAIELSLYPSKQLNEYDDYRHSLMLCVYQLSDQNPFKQLLQNAPGLEKLLECKAFDPSAVGFQRVFLQPGQHQSLQLDRLEGARYVGLAAGYAGLRPGDATKVYPIPMSQAKKGRLWWKKSLYWAGKLSLDIYLDSTSIQRVEGAKDVH